MNLNIYSWIEKTKTKNISTHFKVACGLCWAARSVSAIWKLFVLIALNDLHSVYLLRELEQSAKWIAANWIELIFVFLF